MEAKMKRKVKLPLDMGNDIMVRDIDELKENYNAEKVVEHFLEGRLLKWLTERYYNEEAKAVESLKAEKNAEGLSAKLAKIFGVVTQADVDAEEVAYRSERLNRLREFTSDDEILASVDAVAFDQGDLGDILDLGFDVIYLCGKSFRIPYDIGNKKYIGIFMDGKMPVISVNGTGEIDFEVKGITVENCELDAAAKVRLKAQKLPEPKVNAAVEHISGSSPVPSEKKIIDLCDLYDMEKTYEKKPTDLPIILRELAERYPEAFDKYGKISSAEKLCSIGFKTASFGGFDKLDVTKYIQELSNRINALITDKAGYDHTYDGYNGLGYLKTVSFGGYDKKDVLILVDKLNMIIHTLENAQAENGT